MEKCNLTPRSSKLEPPMRFPSFEHRRNGERMGQNSHHEERPEKKFFMKGGNKIKNLVEQD